MLTYKLDLIQLETPMANICSWGPHEQMDMELTHHAVKDISVSTPGKLSRDPTVQ